MENSLIIFKMAPKFLQYTLTKQVVQYLENNGYIQIQSYSIEDLVHNNISTYYAKYPEIEKRIYPSPSWGCYKKKFKQYISFDDYSLLLNNYFFIYTLEGKQEEIIQFTNIRNIVIHSLVYVLTSVRCNVYRDITISYCKENQLLCDNIIDAQMFMNIYNAISYRQEWFVNDMNPHINYANKSNLEYRQKLLINGDTNFVLENQSMYTEDWWLVRGWDNEYARNQIKMIQKHNSEIFQKKRKENPDQYNSIYENQCGYWEKLGYSKEESIKKVSERQKTFSLSKCIERYGNEQGLIIFKQRQKKWQTTLLEKDNYIEVVQKRVGHGKFSSKVSQDMFDSIRNILIEKNINLDMFYERLNHEWGFGIKKHGGVLYDFVIPDIKYAIEFNGSRFHPNKEKMSKNEFKKWTNPWGKSAKECYKFDMMKNNAIKEKGFCLDIVWDTDYNDNKEKIINDITNKIITLYEQKIS